MNDSEIQAYFIKIAPWTDKRLAEELAHTDAEHAEIIKEEFAYRERTAPYLPQEEQMSLLGDKEFDRVELNARGKAPPPKRHRKKRRAKQLTIGMVRNGKINRR